ncbi:phage NrS-1 polymerase family protein [Natrinema versiforme]|uniref:phage NrS-1 polymerase family protein n=1 Tax=Natrinema versiforme TaxID=88724 RepID=UPI003084454C
MIHREYVKTLNGSGHESGAESTTDEQTTMTTSASDANIGLEEEEDLLERVRNASNGKKFEQLWRGSTAGYESQSDAGMARCCLLAFWTGGDQQQIDCPFRQSGLLRGRGTKSITQTVLPTVRRPSNE